MPVGRQLKEHGRPWFMDRERGTMIPNIHEQRISLYGWPTTPPIRTMWGLLSVFKMEIVTRKKLAFNTKEPLIPYPQIQQ